MRFIVFLLLVFPSYSWAVPAYKTLVRNVTTSGTAQALAAATTYTSHVCIKGKSANAGLMYVGDSTVDANNGYELDPDAEICLGSLHRGGSNEAFNLADIYVDTANNGDGVTVIYVQNRYRAREPVDQ